MSYRFDFQKYTISCDTAAEVKDLLGTPGTVRTPTTKTRRARLRKTNPGTSAWAVARAYAKKRDWTPGAARAYLKSHPRVRAAFVEEMKLDE